MFGKNKKKLGTLITICFVALIGVFFVHAQYAHADDGYSLASLAGDAMYKIIGTVLYWLLYMMTSFIQLLSKGLVIVTHFTLDANLPVIHDSWKIIRNFANMFFIVILIIMAFATIFDVGSTFGYAGYDVNSMIGRFLVVALLINFSLVISGVIIKSTNSVNDVFLAGLGSFDQRLGDALNPSKTLAGIDVSQAGFNKALEAGQFGNGTDLSDVAKIFFSLIMASIIVLSLAVAFIVSIARVPIIWLLLIFAPIAWLCSVLPSIKHYNSMWWKYFWSWNLFLPIFLFILYVGMYILSQQDAVTASISSQFARDVMTSSSNLAPSLRATMQSIFFYIVVGMVFIGGTAMALKTSILAGTGVVSVAQGARSWVKNATGIGGFQKAFVEKKAEIQREGLRIGGVNVVGGPPRGQQFFRRQLQVEGAAAREITEAKDDLKKQNLPIDQLRKLARDKSSRGLAAAELLLDAGKLGSEEAEKILAQYEAISKVAANAFRERLVKKLNDQAKEGEITNAEDLAKFTKLFIAPDDRDKFLNKVARKNALVATEAFANIEGVDEATKRQRLEDTLASISDKEIAEQRLPDPDKMTDPEEKQKAERDIISFQNALKTAIGQNTAQVTRILNQSMSGKQRKIISSALNSSNQKRPIGYNTGTP